MKSVCQHQLFIHSFSHDYRSQSDINRRLLAFRAVMEGFLVTRMMMMMERLKQEGTSHSYRDVLEDLSEDWRLLVSKASKTVFRPNMHCSARKQGCVL